MIFGGEAVYLLSSLSFSQVAYGTNELAPLATCLQRLIMYILPSLTCKLLRRSSVPCGTGFARRNIVRCNRLVCCHQRHRKIQQYEVTPLMAARATLLSRRMQKRRRPRKKVLIRRNPLGLRFISHASSVK